MAAYARFLFEAAVSNGLAIHGWVFMTNHVHLLVTSESDVERQQRYRALFHSQVDGQLLADIGQSVNQGLVFASATFRREIEALGGRRQILMKRGRKTAN